MLKSLGKNQAGDTIIEVMLVLAILGLALGISYATGNRSLQNTRAAEENANASRIAQSQVEGLFALIPPSDNAALPCTLGTNPFCQQNPFCIDQTAAVPILSSGSCTAGIYTKLIYSCNQLGGSYPCSAFVSPSVDTFVVQVTWPDVSGNGSDTVTQIYRDHPSQ